MIFQKKNIIIDELNKLKKFKEDKDLLGIDESSSKLNNLLMEASKEIYQSSEKDSKEKSKEGAMLNCAKACFTAA